ncbi:Asp-tRNA(Asn)/Glu-tRNA(Gln) amidotransferase GatCAB subunit B, partial [bacterium]|nr:Asp-tRNA(Asn)/Glu-tRNA(Gln) amidotransferase GatCAB subunit B [bacterium]
EILTEHIENGLDIDKEIEQSAKAKEESGGQVDQIVKDVIAKNDKAVADYKSGKVAVIGFLVGQVMQATKGTANPADVKNILEKELQ